MLILAQNKMSLYDLDAGRFALQIRETQLPGIAWVIYGADGTNIGTYEKKEDAISYLIDLVDELECCGYDVVSFA